MFPNLVINPFTQLTVDNETEYTCLFSSPKPKFGMQYLKIHKDIQPDLFELFLDLSKIRLDFLNIEEDLSDDERDLLYQHGVLVEEHNIPKKPLFACLLNEVEITEIFCNLNSLIINPSLRVEAVNLSNFSSLINKYVSPYQPIVWINTEISNIEIGYWLSNEHAEIISKFKAGEPLPFEIENGLLSKLISAKIVISPENINTEKETNRRKIEESKRCFSANKYAILREILPPSQMKAMRNYYRDYIDQGFMPFGDEQVDRRFYQHNEPLAKFLHQNLTNLMCLIAGKEVEPTYVYAASYREGATLEPHIDRDACEYSFSFQVDYLPEQKDYLSPWALCLSTKEIPINHSGVFPFKDFSIGASDTKEVYLASGDCLIYKGCELIHFRHALPKNHQSTSLFFHYIQKKEKTD